MNHLRLSDIFIVHHFILLVHITDYIEQMLNESKTRLPCLTELQVDYDQLRTITNKFTRYATFVITTYAYN